MDSKALIAILSAAAGLGSGYFGANIWEGQYGEARQDLATCRDAYDDLRDSHRLCTEELLRCDPRAGRIMLRERALEAAPDVAAPPAGHP